MTWLISTQLGRALWRAVALLSAFLTFGAAQHIKGRKQGAQRVSRRAELAASERKDLRNEIDDDDDVSAARDRLLETWSNRANNI